MTDQAASGAIVALPVEILVMVLSSTGDVTALQAAISSCRTFRRVFYEWESTIIYRVLLNQMDESLVVDGLGAYEASKLPSGDKPPEVCGAIAQSLWKRSASRACLGFKEALFVSKLHVQVQELAEEFAKEVLQHPVLASANYAPSRQEMIRIQRGFYRFEAYRHCLRGVSSSDYHREKVIYDGLNPWEREQMSCVLEFLSRRVAQVFSDVACHDIYWGANGVHYDTRPMTYSRCRAPGIYHILMQGLEKLVPFLYAETYEDRYRVCDAQNLPSEESNVDFVGLRAQDMDYTPGVHRPIALRSPYDMDHGPEDIWLWAYEGFLQDRRRNINVTGLREWAFVMWDSARLEAMGWLHKTWQHYSTEHMTSIPSAAEFFTARGLPEEHSPKESWAWRKHLWSLGASGYWSAKDDSKVVWKGTRPDSYALPDGMYKPASETPHCG